MSPDSRDLLRCNFRGVVVCSHADVQRLRLRASAGRDDWRRREQGHSRRPRGWRRKRSDAPHRREEETGAPRDQTSSCTTATCEHSTTATHTHTHHRALIHLKQEFNPPPPRSPSKHPCFISPNWVDWSRTRALVWICRDSRWVRECVCTTPAHVLCVCVSV